MKIIIPLKYDMANMFENGFGVVEKDKKFALVDKSGKEYFNRNE